MKLIIRAFENFTLLRYNLRQLQPYQVLRQEHSLKELLPPYFLRGLQWRIQLRQLLQAPF